MLYTVLHLLHLSPGCRYMTAPHFPMEMIGLAPSRIRLTLYTSHGNYLVNLFLKPLVVKQLKVQAPPARLMPCSVWYTYRPKDQVLIRPLLQLSRCPCLMLNLSSPKILQAVLLQAMASHCDSGVCLSQTCLCRAWCSI